MDEQRPDSGEPELKRPDQIVKDLEPDEHEGEAVKGGGIAGEGQGIKHPTDIDVSSY